MLRLAYFVSHPIQYQAPLLRLIAADPEIDLKVFFYSNFSLKPFRDQGFGRTIKWDIPLTEEYNHHFLDCWGSDQWQSWIQQPIAKDIFRQLEQESFDAIWVHGWAWLCSIQAVLAANHLGIPVLLRGESNGLREPAHFIKKKLKKGCLDWLFEKITGFLSIGTLNYQFYQSYGIKEKQLFYVPYAVDNRYFQEHAMRARAQRETLRRSLNLTADRPIILYAAKLIDVKRPQDLLRAYKQLSPDGIKEPDPYLLFIGDGRLRPILETEAKETGWNSIRFLGFLNQSELPSIYELCDMFVLPSEFEPWGLAINEVMNAGKAVIVTDQVGCAPDLVIEGQNGQVYPAGQVAALAEAIRWSIENSVSAGNSSLQRIQTWSYQEDLQGLKQALNYVTSN